MERSRRAFSSVSAPTTRAGLRALVALPALVTGMPLAIALPPVNGSNCNSNWVNNEGALECFIQGEEEANSGTSPPHYVGCSADGEIFCCVDRNGGQVCESLAGAARANVEQQVRAILEGQAAVLANMARISKRLDSLEDKLSDQNRKN